MTTLEQYLSLEHPKLRKWEILRKSKDVADWAVKVEREKNGLVFLPTKLCIVLLDSNGKQVRRDCDEWDDDLNAGLIKKHVRAIDANNEAVRFSLVLLKRFRIAENRFGDGFFNSVLLLTVRNSELFNEQSVANVMNHIAKRPVPTKTVARQDCEEMIGYFLGTCASELREDLKYRDSDMKTILAKALAHYLDDRFSVTNRRALGWASAAS